jgi:hypothetical protein
MTMPRLHHRFLAAVITSLLMTAPLRAADAPAAPPDNASATEAPAAALHPLPEYSTANGSHVPTVISFRSNREPEHEWAVAAQASYPIDSDVWQFAAGADAAYIRWTRERFGYGATLSVMFWVPNSSASFATEDKAARQKIEVDSQLSGSAISFTPGVAAFYRKPMEDGGEWLMRGGLGYTLVSSSLEAEFSYISHFGSPTTVKVPVSIDDRPVALLGVDYVGKTEEGKTYLVGLAASIDLIRGSSNWLYEDVGNQMDAVTLRAGLMF